MREPNPAREEHLHLLGRRVLRLVEDDERVVQRAATHVRQRSDLDRARRQEFRNQLRVHHLVERVVEGAQVRVDLVGEGTRQVAQAFAGLDRRTGQDDAADLLALKRLHRLRHREIRLARTGGTDAEDDRVVVDRVDVLLLPRSSAGCSLPRAVRMAWLSTSAGLRLRSVLSILANS
jgi:hypothetical protein